MKKERLSELDLITGIAIFLVVLGHIASRNDLNDIFWYSNLKTLIYKFHMPLFMFISGAIAYYSYNKNTNYFYYLKLKFNRIVPGFLLFSGIIIFGKYFANMFLHVDNFENEILNNIYNVLFFPSKSVAGSLWYIYVLLQFYIFLPFLIKINKKNLFLLSLLLHILYINYNITDFMMLDKFSEYLLFFTLGFIYIEKRIYLLKYLLKYKYFFFMNFLISFLSIKIVNEDLSKLIIGFSSIPFFLLISSTVVHFKLRKLLNLFAEYTYTIYLMNTIFIGLTKALMLSFLTWGGIHFIIMFPFLLLSGLMMPILFHKFILKYTILNKITK